MHINAKTIAVSGLLAGCAAGGGASAGAVAAAATASNGNGAPAGAAGVAFVPESGPARPHRCTYTGRTGSPNGNMPNVSACNHGNADFLAWAPAGTYWVGWLWSTTQNRWTDYNHNWTPPGGSGAARLETNVAYATIGHAQTLGGGGILAMESLG